MQVLQHVIPQQEGTTHIDVGADNSTPEQTWCADRVELPGLLRLADFATADTVRSFRVRFGVWTISSPSTTSRLQALAWSPIFLPAK